MWAIIGGSGFEKFDAFETIENLDTETPFGRASSGMKKVKVYGVEALFISRHGENHELLPSEVNFRANIWALKKYGARAIISFSAVGSLRAEIKPGDMVIPDQYIDRTKGIRQHTYCGDGVVGHVSLAEPVESILIQRAGELTQGTSWDNHFNKTYVCIEGPYFSTQAESHLYRSMSADIIGMTHFPEYALVREVGLPYLPCCFITDFDCWDDSRPHVTVAEVIQVMRKNNAKAFEFLGKVLNQGPAFYEDLKTSEKGLKTGLMTDLSRFSKDRQDVFQVITG